MKKNKLILSIFSFATFFCCNNVHALTEQSIPYKDFLGTLGNVCNMFLKYLIKFCNSLIDNYFFFTLLGIALFIGCIRLAFELWDLFGWGLDTVHNNIEKYLEEKSDLEVKSLDLATKELVMRQNYEYNLQQSIQKDSIKELVMRQNYEYNLQQSIQKDSIKELVMRQNRLQVFNPVLNNISNIPDSSFINSLKIRNFKNYNYGMLDQQFNSVRIVPMKNNQYLVNDSKFVSRIGSTVDEINKRDSFRIDGGSEVPPWFGKDIPLNPTTPEEKSELEKILKNF